MATNTDQVMYLRVYLTEDPTVEVWVKTTESKNRSKRNSIVSDVNYQKFPRWAPFANKMYSIDWKIAPYKEDKTTPFFD